MHMFKILLTSEIEDIFLYSKSLHTACLTMTLFLFPP